MPIDPEKLAIGRAVIRRSLGGARLSFSVDSLVAAIAEAFALDRSKPESAWPDYLAQALADVDSDLERLAERSAELSAASARARSLDSILAIYEGKTAAAIAARPGERLDSAGRPIRSNTAWRQLATAAIAERLKLEAELTETREALATVEAARKEAERQAAQDWTARNAAQGRANNAESKEAAALLDALIWAAGDDESRALAFGLADCLKGIPLEALAESEAWPKAAELYLQAKALRAEEPAERRARLAARLESGNG